MAPEKPGKLGVFSYFVATLWNDCVCYESSYHVR